MKKTASKNHYQSWHVVMMKKNGDAKIFYISPAFILLILLIFLCTIISFAYCLHQYTTALIEIGDCRIKFKSIAANVDKKYSHISDKTFINLKSLDQVLINISNNQELIADNKQDSTSNEETVAANNKPNKEENNAGNKPEQNTEQPSLSSQLELKKFQINDLGDFSFLLEAKDSKGELYAGYVFIAFYADQKDNHDIYIFPEQANNLQKEPKAESLQTIYLQGQPFSFRAAKLIFGRTNLPYKIENLLKVEIFIFSTDGKLLLNATLKDNNFLQTQ